MVDGPIEELSLEELCNRWIELDKEYDRLKFAEDQVDSAAATLHMFDAEQRQHVNAFRVQTRKMRDANIASKQGIQAEFARRNV